MDAATIKPDSLQRVLRAAERRADELITDFFSLASPTTETDPMSVISDHMSKVLGLASIRRSWSECHNTLFPDPSLPPKAWEQNVAGYLFERRYHPESIRLVLDDANAWGTVECCAELAFSDADRARVESLLPESGWDNPVYDGRWELGVGLDLVA